MKKIALILLVILAVSTAIAAQGTGEDSIRVKTSPKVSVKLIASSLTDLLSACNCLEKEDPAAAKKLKTHIIALLDTAERDELDNLCRLAKMACNPDVRKLMLQTKLIDLNAEAKKLGLADGDELVKYLERFAREYSQFNKQYLTETPPT